MDMATERRDTGPEEITYDTEEVPAPEIDTSETVYTLDEVETQHKRTRGGDFIPRTKLEPALSRVIIITSIIILFTGITLCALGVVIHGINSYKATGNEPHLWWTGVVPFFLGMQGMYSGVKSSRSMALHWGTLSAMTSLTQTAVMGSFGDFSLALFDVWPLIGQREGHPVCRTMAEACTCQDYFHGFYSYIELPGFNYIYTKTGPSNASEIVVAPRLHEIGSGITKWKQTRFKHCNDLYLISILYFSTMGTYAIFTFVSVIAFCLGLAASICAKHKTRFRNLSENEAPDAEEDAEDVGPVYQPYLDRAEDICIDKELQTIPPWPHDSAPWPHDSALAQSSLYRLDFPEPGESESQDGDVIIHTPNTQEDYVQ